MSFGPVATAGASLAFCLAVAIFTSSIGFAETARPIANQNATPIGPRWIFQAPDDPTNVASIFVDTVIDAGLAALTQAQTSRQLAHEIFRQIFSSAFASEQIGQAVLGRIWSTASIEQRDAFLDVLAIHLADVIIDRVPDGRFQVRGASLAGQSELGLPQTEVVTVFVGQNFSARVPWIVATVDGEMKILDITFARTSFLLGQKGDFDRILQRNGGSLDGLIETLGR